MSIECLNATRLLCRSMYISYESIQGSLKFNVVGFTLIMTGVYAIADITPIERVKIMKENDKKKKKWERYE